MFQSTSFLASVGLTLLAIVVAVVAQGQEIGSLYQCAHGLRGKVFVKNEREIIIQGFNYDGKGPAAWFHGQLKGSQGIYTSDPTMYETLPYPNGTCDRLKPGRSYADEDITLILPQSIKDFETIGVFCYQYCHNFGHIRIPSDLNVPAAPITLQLVNNCGKPNYDTCSLEKTRNRLELKFTGY